MIVGLKIMCFLSVIPVRGENADASEMVTQLLFGEVATVIEKDNQWLKINIEHDGYIGWIDEKQVIEISENAFSHLSQIANRQKEATTSYQTPWGKVKVLQGSPVISEKRSFRIDDYEFKRLEKSSEQNPEGIEEIAMSYINAPYLWGGRTHFGIDCSGLTQSVLHQLGVNLLRDASMQVKQGEEISFKKIKPGDLAFFISEKGNITHVGITLSDGRIIHASGRVRIDKLTAEGIYNKEVDKLTHRLHSIRRFKY